MQGRLPRGAAAAAALAAMVVLHAGGCQGPADPMQKKRNDMVETQIAARGIRDPRVLEAMRTVPRHLFVPPAEAASAYADRPLPIGSGQTISQPYVVAFMSEQLRLTGKEKVLEIGTGSGYSTAILAALASKVFSIEIRPELSHQAKERLEKLGVKNVELRAADGYRGWPEEAPFDAILVTAAPERIPPPLLEQLAPEGRMVIPVGAFYQELKVIKRQGGGYSEKSVLPVRFVPFVGEAEGAPPPARDPGSPR
ncbi:MAG TPA: protein-L-isoaspartate(D-aspartate) O-methyltransferase [Thermoanaerobaculia bacterium]|nr:protein-L-isoaspartate(D-aspartate) O-methyltransferase [Thermoanaerobaculia bacterium]